MFCDHVVNNFDLISSFSLQLTVVIKKLSKITAIFKMCTFIEDNHRERCVSESNFAKVITLKI